ncbi:MAG: WD40 repeat domain-containing protein [Chloroflexota bacterium]
MRQRFFPKLLILSLFLTLFTTVSAQAQRSYIPITAQNVARISQVERFGNGVPRMMTFSPDESRLAVATTLGVWLIRTPIGVPPGLTPNKHVLTQFLEGQSGVESIAFSPDGAEFAAGGDDNSVMVFDTVASKGLERLINHIYPVSAVAWSSDGKWIASGDWSGIVRLWDTSNWSEYRVFADAEAKIEALRFEQSNSQITAISSNGRYLWDITSGMLLSQIESTSGVGASLQANAGEWSAAYSVDNAQITLSNQGTLMATVDDFYGELGGVFFAWNDEVGASPLKPIYRWSLVIKQRAYSRPVLSPDGARLATFGNDGVIRLSESRFGHEIAALHGHIRAVTDVAFSPDGKLLVSSSNDGTLQLWDATVTQDSGSLATLKGHNGGVSSVAFNADGTLIASSGYDGTIRLWGLKT